MANFELKDLTEPLTELEVKTTVYEILDQLGINTTSWKLGAVVRTIITVFSIALSYCTYLIAGIAQSGFLVYAQGAWLTLVARNVYNIERIDADQARGHATLTNTSGTPYTFDPEDLILSAPAADTEYRNTESVTVPAMGSVTFSIECIQVGATRAEAGQVSTLVTPLGGVTATNAVAIIGLDAETDPALRARCKASTAALSPFGPADAYRFAATSAKRPSGESCGVTRVRLIPDGQGGIQAYVATSVGEVPAGIGEDPDSDLAIVADAMQRKAAPLGITLDVESVDEVEIDIEYTAYVYDSVGLSESQIKAKIAEALASRIARLPIGGDVLPSTTFPGKLYVDAIRGAIDNTLPEHIYHVTIASPAADVSIQVNQVAVLNPPDGTIVFTEASDTSLV